MKEKELVKAFHVINNWAASSKPNWVYRSKETKSNTYQQVIIVQILGYIVIAIGAFLWAGNVFHFFPTFPLVGYATMLVGGIIKKTAK